MFLIKNNAQVNIRLEQGLIVYEYVAVVEIRKWIGRV